MGIFDFLKPKPKARDFPPVPDWRPDFSPSREAIVERVRYYTDGRRDIAVFRFGTCVILEPDLPDKEAVRSALKVLEDIFLYHPDMNPQDMDDGNILVQYNHPAVNVVLSSFCAQHWAAIEANHLRALARSEVLLTSLGPNVFDDFSKKALYGRCFMFMDAQDPEVVQIARAG